MTNKENISQTTQEHRSIDVDFLSRLVCDILNHPNLLSYSKNAGDYVLPLSNIYLEFLMIYTLDEMNDIGRYNILQKVKEGIIRPLRIDRTSFSDYFPTTKTVTDIKTVTEYLFLKSNFSSDLSGLGKDYFENVKWDITRETQMKYVDKIIKDSLEDIWRVFYYALFNLLISI